MVTAFEASGVGFPVEQHTDNTVPNTGLPQRGIGDQRATIDRKISQPATEPGDIPGEQAQDPICSRSLTKPAKEDHSARATLVREPLDASLLTVEQVAERLNCSTRHIYRMSDRGDMPAPIKLGKKLVRWQRQVFEKWLAAGCPRVRR